MAWRRLLSFHFSWTPEQVLQLTLFDFDDYVKFVEAVAKGG